jgi:hypothetical protein
MPWDVHLMKAPEDAVRLHDVPERYGYLGRAADVVERLRSIIPKQWFDNAENHTTPSAWFTTEDIRGGVECDAYGLSIYLHTLEEQAYAGPGTVPAKLSDTVEYVNLAFHKTGARYRNMNDLVWDFIADACRALECRALDFDRFLGSDGRPVPELSRPWWRFWR